jgi:hypothetical protein
MPPYILCIRCTVVPVAKVGDLCEDCRRKDQEAQKKIDKLYGDLLNAAQRQKRKNYRGHK